MDCRRLPAEMEAVLVGMPELRDCAVFGIPDETYGESVCVYIEPQDGATVTADAVRDFLGQDIARYMLPKVIEFRPALPREDSGKILKRKLRAPSWYMAGRQI